MQAAETATTTTVLSRAGNAATKTTTTREQKCEQQRAAQQRSLNTLSFTVLGCRSTLCPLSVLRSFLSRCLSFYSLPALLLRAGIGWEFKLVMRRGPATTTTTTTLVVGALCSVVVAAAVVIRCYRSAAHLNTHTHTHTRIVPAIHGCIQCTVYIHTYSCLYVQQDSRQKPEAQANSSLGAEVDGTIQSSRFVLKINKAIKRFNI